MIQYLQASQYIKVPIYTISNSTRKVLVPGSIDWVPDIQGISRDLVPTSSFQSKGEIKSGCLAVIQCILCLGAPYVWTLNRVLNILTFHLWNLSVWSHTPNKTFHILYRCLCIVYTAFPSTNSEKEKNWTFLKMTSIYDISQIAVELKSWKSNEDIVKWSKGEPSSRIFSQSCEINWRSLTNQ